MTDPGSASTPPEQGARQSRTLFILEHFIEDCRNAVACQFSSRQPALLTLAQGRVFDKLCVLYK